MKSSFVRKAIAIVPKAYHAKGRWLIVLLIFNSALDFFSVAVFLPLLILMISPEEHAWINRFQVFTGAQSRTQLIVIFTIGILTFLILKNVISVAIGVFKSRLAFMAGNELANQRVHGFLHQDFLSYAKSDLAFELHRLTSHAFAFSNNIIVPLSNLITEGFVSLFIIVSIGIYDPVMMVVMALLLPAYLILRLQRNSLANIRNELKTKFPRLMRHASEVTEGFLDIRLSGKERLFQKYFTSTHKEITDSFIAEQKIQTRTSRTTEVLVAATICSLVIYTSLAHLTYVESVILIGAYAAATYRLVPSLNRILLAFQQISMHKYLVDELQPYGESLIPEADSASKPTFTSKIELRDLSFQFPERPQLLQGLNMTILKGQRVALIGKSGCGKTTVLLLLMKLLTESAGHFFVDGHDIENSRGWRKLIGYVPQNPYILDGTIADNIVFGSEVDTDQIGKIMDQLGLSDLIDQLPDGINTRIGAHGVSLSGGQRQRLSIARALYADASILLLDEVTSQLDPASEASIMHALRKLSDEGMTMVMVTHQESLSDFFDVVYKIEDGRAVAKNS